MSDSLFTCEGPRVDAWSQSQLPGLAECCRDPPGSCSLHPLVWNLLHPRADPCKPCRPLPAQRSAAQQLLLPPMPPGCLEVLSHQRAPPSDRVWVSPESVVLPNVKQSIAQVHLITGARREITDQTRSLDSREMETTALGTCLRRSKAPQP